MAAALLSSRAVVSVSVRARLVRARVASRHRARATAAYAGRAKRITVHDANDLLASDASVVYLDVRSEGEYKDQHRVGSVNIPVADMQGGAPVPNPKFVESVNAAYPGKTQRFVVGCLSGARSEKAVALLTADGWPGENLLDLEGGFRKYNKEFTPEGKPRAKPGVWKDSGPITWTDS